MRSADKHCSRLLGCLIAIKFNFLFLPAQLQILKESCQMASEKIYLGKEDVMALNLNGITEI